MPEISTQSSGRASPLTAPFILIAVCFASTAVVAFDLMIEGPLRWHVRQPASIQGAVEALLLIGAWVAFARKQSRGLLSIALVAGFLYVRRHNAELALIFGLFYVEALFALGVFARKATGTRAFGASSVLPIFLLGICLWLLTSLFLSTFRLATPEALLVLLLAGGSLFILVNRRSATHILLKNINQRPSQ